MCTITLATNIDAKEIASLSRTLIEYGLRSKYTEKKIKALIRHESTNVAVAKHNDKLIGFGIMSYGESHANLDLLATRKESQGKGVAGKIVKWLELVALNAGISHVGVQARETNTRGVNFYLNLGYKKCGLTQHVYGTESQIRMEKKLWQ
ncbi:MAG: GNAT family N-acetyltransferase [Pseudomonadota bacterium]